jgi:MFS family permease
MMAFLFCVVNRTEDMTRTATAGRLAGLDFPPLVWMTLGGTLLTRTAFFMVWPFLAVILTRDYHVSAPRVGAIIGSAFFVGGLVAFYSGNLSDRFGRRRVMTAGCASAVAAYATLATARSLEGYTIGAFLVGITRGAFEAPGTALIADCIDAPRTRQLALHARYFLINVAGAIGPFIGVVFGLSARQQSFWITAAVYAGFALILNWTFSRTPMAIHTDARTHASLRRAVAVLRDDHQFLLLVAANFLVMSAYAQMESTLIQYISRADHRDAVGLVATLLATNALTIVTFQFPMLRLLRAYGLYQRTYSSLVLFGVAFLAYALLPVHMTVPWVIATWVLSVGEAVLFPTLQLQADSMARASARQLLRRGVTRRTGPWRRTRHRRLAARPLRRRRHVHAHGGVGRRRRRVLPAITPPGTRDA